METLTVPVGCNYIEHPKEEGIKKVKETSRILSQSEVEEIVVCLTLRPALSCTCGKYSIKWEVSSNGSHRS